MIKNRIRRLREKMAERKIDAYIIPSSDPHQSEYLADHYKTREYISGFTGSAGTVVVTMDKAGLWTDGRYFIQAEEQLKDTGIDLYRMGVENVPTIIEFIQRETPEHGKVALDGSSYPYDNYLQLLKKLGSRMILTDIDYIGEIWENRPEIPGDKVFLYEKEYTGQNTSEKLQILRSKMREAGADYHFIGSLEDICYLMNIRGHDISFNPVVISYALISMEVANLYIDMAKVPEEVLNYLRDNGVRIKDYDRIFEDLAEIPGKSVIYIDPKRTNVNIYHAINSNVRFIKGRNMTEMMKAIKNEVELEHLKNAFIKDGVALVKFFNWLETGAPTGTLTEYYVADRLHDFRREGEDFIEESFGTISAYGENAALPHYSPIKGRSATIKNRGFYLVDSGGHYLDGTTDITRTLAMGDLSEDEKYHYTLVLKAHIQLMLCDFPRGTKSSMLDSITRYPLWREHLDFNHGTGHGVGYLLSVHEGPQSISKVNNEVDMLPGMVTSNEPGIYIEGSHGIRIENIMVCIRKEENEFGDFLGFEPLSYIPIDTRPVMKELLSPEEIDWLNDYHKKVFEKLSPYLEGDEFDYLEKSTLEI
ncbi:MAG: aminopeptidase P family protein [Tissierellia bacterium]|nr:aminopeptidase P family protein [Tissierellia bacterium]